MISIGVLFCIPVVFQVYIKTEIQKLYLGKNWGILYEVVTLIYPRFFVEIHRFDVVFFVSHASQVLYRFEIITVLTLLFLYKYWSNSTFKTSVTSLWNNPYSEINSKICHFVIYGSILFYMRDFIESYVFLNTYKDLYDPILLLKVFKIPLFSQELVVLLFVVFVIACLSSMMGIFLRINTLLATLLFLLFQGWSYSFGKINHGFAPLTYISILLVIKSYTGEKENKTILQLIKITIASCYLMAGLEKLFISQLSWVSATTFSTYLLQHPTPIGLSILKHSSICTILPSLALLIQIGFVFILFFPKLKNAILISGVLFHFGTVALFGISSYFHPWVVTYVFFIDWQKILFKPKTEAD